MEAVSLCSLYLLQRRINDDVRLSIASKAAAAKKEDVQYISGQSPKKYAGPTYLVVVPDPCEDPEKVYVDVAVKRNQDIKLSKEWENLFDKLKKLGSWKCGSRRCDDQESEENHRRNAMEKLSFVGRPDSAVNLPEWQELNDKFSRRLTLRHFCRIILDSGIVKSKDDCFDAIFETPFDVTDCYSLANRVKFTKEFLIRWFFSFDTYSKCIIFLESVIRYLEAQASTLSLLLNDIYCEVFTQIIRRTYITKVNDASPENSLAPTSDTKLLPVTDCVKNFLISTLSFNDEEYRFATNFDTGNWVFPKNTETFTESIMRILNKKDEDSRHPTYRAQFEEKESMRYCITDGYENGMLSPLRVYIRKEPLIPYAHNHLVFPVFEDEKKGSDILFFLQLRPISIASLLLPGLFRNKKQYLSGECRWMNNKNEEAWKYSLADYCPLREP